MDEEFKKPESMPLFIAIAPFGAYVQFCDKCGNEDIIGDFELIEDNKYLCCSKCGRKVAVFHPGFTAQLHNIGGAFTYH